MDNHEIHSLSNANLSTPELLGILKDNQAGSLSHWRPVQDCQEDAAMPKARTLIVCSLIVFVCVTAFAQEKSSALVNFHTFFATVSRR